MSRQDEKPEVRPRDANASLSQETMLELMQYADGELEGEARVRVENLLRTSEEARGVVDAMGALGEVVREGVEARATASTAADRIADGVMAALASDGVQEAEGQGRVVPLAEARPFHRGHRGRSVRVRGGVTAAAVAALALAAGVFFFVTTKAPAPTAKEEPVPSAPPSAAAAERAAIAPGAESVAQADAPGVDLLEARSIRNKVNVFFMPPAQSAGAAASVVVWIDDRHGGQ